MCCGEQGIQMQGEVAQSLNSIDPSWRSGGSRSPADPTTGRDRQIPSLSLLMRMAKFSPTLIKAVG